MNEKELAKRVVDILKDNNVRKDVRATRVVFHISDDEGNSKDFVAKKPRTDVLFDKNDVMAIMQAFMAAVSDAILKGEEIRMYNFGTFKLKQKAASRARHPETKELVDVPSYYYPSFVFARRLKNAAKFFTASEQERDGISEELMNDIYNSIDNGFEFGTDIDEDE